MNKIQQTKKGFTIIEVVLVLAIAGLIFLMVFLALPALQRSQRNTQRKNDASRLMAAINDFKAANRGQNPAGGYTHQDARPRTVTGMASVVWDYVKTGGATFVDPSTNRDYTITQFDGSRNERTTRVDAGTMEYVTNAACGQNGNTTSGTGQVLRVGVEGGGNAYCVQA